MVFLHGGSFRDGSGHQSFGYGNIYSGCPLAAEHDVITVTLNYRLGALGWLAFEQEAGVSANFGITDQRQALKWLKNEISHFGGDAHKVTLFGQSAGAISVLHHMVSPLSKGLFRAAISESGMPFSFDKEHTLDQTRDFAKRVHCPVGVDASTLECMRTKTSMDLISHNYGHRKNATGNPFLDGAWAPTVDGVDLPESALQMFVEGRSAHVPLLAGTNSDEGNAFVYPWYPKGMNQKEFQRFTQLAAGTNGFDFASFQDRLVESYGVHRDNRPEAAQLLGDATFVCGTRFASLAHSGHTHTYLYRFDHRLNCSRLGFSGLPGVFHAAELPLVFGTRAKFLCPSRPKESRLQERMQTMWTNFAKNLHPSTSIKGEEIPRYHAHDQKSLVLHLEKDNVEQFYRQDRCNVWKPVLSHAQQQDEADFQFFA
jgi:carboxylesterase type B